MSFGFGIGDFLAVINLANKLRKDFSTAPTQYQAIAAEVNNFSVLIKDVSTYFEGHSPTETQRNELSGIILSCRHILLEVEKLLSKYSNLESPGQATGVREYMKRTWQRVKLEPEDIRDFRDRIVVNISLLNAYVGSFDRGTLTQLVLRQDDFTTKQQALVQRQHLLEDQEILDWLAPADYAAQHSSYVGQRLPDTGQWLLESPEYVQWSSPALQSKSLYLSGIPGAGKTILSSIVIDDLQARYSLDDDIGVCYYYCDYKRQDDQKLDQILLRLVRQLATSPGLPIVRDLHSRHTIGARPTLLAIKNTLHAIVKQLSSTFVVLDALDECRSRDGCQKALLAGLSELNRLPDANVKILITSRNVYDNSTSFVDFKLMEVLASDQDIHKYVTAHIQDLPNFVAQRPELQEEIKVAIINAVGGMFLLATLHLRALQGKRSIRKLRLTLDSLSSSNYPEAYTTTMDRICSQLEDQRNLAIDALTWIVYAQRSLTSAELLHALAVDIDSPEFYVDDIPDIQDVLSACCGLVIVEQETRFVRLVHQTTQDFLKERGSTWLPKPHTRLGKICNTYLAFKAVASARDCTEEVFQDLLTEYPLYDYASWHCWDHAKLRDDLGVEELVNSQKQIDKSSEVLLARTVSEYLSLRRRYPDFAGVHLLAYCGLTEMMPKFLERYDVNEVDESMRTPISCAFQGERLEAMRLLIENGARFSDRYEVVDGQVRLSMDKSSNIADTLLVHSIDLGVHAVTHLLMDVGAELDTTISKIGQTLLCKAAERNEIYAPRILVENGVDVNQIYTDGRTPLILASHHGHIQIVQFLLDNKADINKAAHDGRTPLFSASCQGYSEIIKLLLDRNAEIDKADKYGCTPLHAASYNGQLEIARFLLAKNAEIDKADRDGWTPLNGASANGHLETVRLLLAKNAEIDKADKDGYTPLCGASANGHLETVRLLLAKNAEIDKAEKDGVTPLIGASANGHLEVVRLLLAKNAEIDKAGKDGWTPLYGASSNGHLEIVQLLLDRNADINRVTSDCWTPLHIALDKRHSEIAQLLFDRGADPKTKLQSGETPLFTAARKGLTEMVKLLHKREASSSIEWTVRSHKDDLGRNVLHHAAVGGDITSFDYLMDRNEFSMDEDQFGRSILDYASMSDSSAMIRRVLRYYRLQKLDMESSSPWSSLHWACQMGSRRHLHVLIRAGLRSRQVQTEIPAVRWLPLDVAVFWKNKKLLSKVTNAISQGEDVQKNDAWLWALTSQNKLEPHTPISKLALRSNDLEYPGGKNQGWCSGCFLDMHGQRFCSKHARGNYCFMCKHSADKAIPEREWNWIEQEVDGEDTNGDHNEGDNNDDSEGNDGEDDDGQDDDSEDDDSEDDNGKDDDDNSHIVPDR